MELGQLRQLLACNAWRAKFALELSVTITAPNQDVTDDLKEPGGRSSSWRCRKMASAYLRRPALDAGLGFPTELHSLPRKVSQTPCQARGDVRGWGWGWRCTRFEWAPKSKIGSCPGRHLPLQMGGKRPLIHIIADWRLSRPGGDRR